MTNAQLLEKEGIDLKRKTKGSIKTLCPKCSEGRTQKKDPCLSVDIDEGLWNCHHCGYRGRVVEKPVKEHISPAPRLEKLRPQLIEWFEKKRGISNNTLLRFGITEAVEWMPKAGEESPVICFNYFRDGELVNIKFRGAAKDFKMAKDAELVFYNLDAAKSEKEIVIVEGEIDALSLYESGIYNVLSVPNGASKGSAKLEYVDNCIDRLSAIESIILWTDNDEAGYHLREELARRLGKRKCKRVTHVDGCKDANEVLLKFGVGKVKETVSEAQPWPIEGVHTLEDMYPDIQHYYEHGYPSGVKLNLGDLGEYLQLMPGQLTTVTGIPGSGKSEIVDAIMVDTSRTEQWQWGVCSFENQPSSFHVTKIAEKFGGKAFGFRQNPYNRMNISECEWAIVQVAKHFHFININQVEVTLNGILEKAEELVERKGINGLVIDPWNYIEHHIPKGYTETQYISECLTKIKAFAMLNGVHVILIAHPTKIGKDKQTGKYEVPTLYSISGSAHFFNKTDNGLSVWRDFSDNRVEVHVQKVRYSWLGKIGMSAFSYDVEKRQYNSLIA